MGLALQATPVPLREDDDGGLRIGATRVGFESVWRLHQEGASPAEIVQAFDTLDPADVYAVLAWALRNPRVVARYLSRRDEQADEIRHQLEQAGVTPNRTESARCKERLNSKWRDRQR